MTAEPVPAGADPLALPDPQTQAGKPRRVGVEIEFGGLTEARAAEIVADTLGGRAEDRGQHHWTVEGGALGSIKVELDTAFRSADGKLAELGLEIARSVVPVEIVTDPLAVDDIARLDALCAALRSAGALGSRQGVFLGFGVHFNPEIRSPDVADLLPILRAYAFAEDWLRLRFPIDTMRWLLPFVDRYPPSLLDALAAPEASALSRTGMAQLYLSHVRSRNHGLDLLPLLAHLEAEAVAAALGPDGAKGARPTWHFRLPDCRIDETDWSLIQGWRMWLAVERIAADPALLDRLAAAWRARRAQLLPGEDWAQTAAVLLDGADGVAL